MARKELDQQEKIRELVACFWPTWRISEEMPFYRIKNKDVLFVHVPKTGGTSVNGTLRSEGKRFLHYTHRIPGLKVAPQHFHAEILSALFHEYEFDYVFMIVRNPLLRVASEYRMRAENGRLEGIDINAWWQNCMAEYKKNPFYLDNHIRPQVEFLLPYCNVFRLETGLQYIMTDVFSAIGLSNTPTKVHVRKGSGQPINLTDDTLDSIFDFYQEDFKIFKYPQERYAEI